MKIEDQVASVELSKELKALGVKQDSVWFWNKYITSRLYLSVGKQFEDKIATDGTYLQYSISAFTVAELGEMLPSQILRGVMPTPYYFSIDKYDYNGDIDWRVKYRNESIYDTFRAINANTEADARAKMLIYLINERIIKVGNIK